MVGHGGSSAGSYLADLTSPIPSHCASIVVTSTLRVKLVLTHMVAASAPELESGDPDQRVRSVTPIALLHPHHYSPESYPQGEMPGHAVVYCYLLQYPAVQTEQYMYS